MSWGELDENGKPISKRSGSDYIKWVNKVLGYNYSFDYRILNSADFGAYTSRKRYFGIFAKENLPIAFPEPTHSKKVSVGLFETLKRWKPVKEVLDLSDEGESIFNRKKPLVDSTLERIYAGLLKFVAGGKEHFLLKYNSMNKAGKYLPPSIDEPSPVVSCQGRLCLVEARFLTKYFSGRPDGKVISINGPAGAIKTIDGHSLVNCKFISTHYGNGFNRSIEEPAATVTTKDRHAIINPQFFANVS